MTRESWHDGTYSHGWGTSAVVGIAWGLMGIHQTSPAFGTFIVKPKLGGLSDASITIPTIRGYINVTASPGTVSVQVPCNSMATLCIPRSAQDEKMFTPQSHHLLLDDVEETSVASGGHLCMARDVSCGENGSPRRLHVQLR